MTLQERLDTYLKQHAELDKIVQEGAVNLHRLGGAIAAVQDQIKEEAEKITHKTPEPEQTYIPPGD